MDVSSLMVVAASRVKTAGIRGSPAYIASTELGDTGLTIPTQRTQS